MQSGGAFAPRPSGLMQMTSRAKRNRGQLIVNAAYLHGDCFLLAALKLLV